MDKIVDQELVDYLIEAFEHMKLGDFRKRGE